MHRKNPMRQGKLASITGLMIAVSASTAVVAQHESTKDTKVNREVKIEARVENGDQQIRVWIDGDEHEVGSMDEAHELLRDSGGIEIDLVRMDDGTDAKVIRDVRVTAVEESDEHGHGHIERAPRAMLGVMMDETPEELAEYFELNSADCFMVIDVVDDSAAEKAGLQKKDIVLALRATKDGTFRTMGVEDTRAFIAKQAPGDELEIKILRKGEAKVLKARLTEWSGEQFGSIEKVQDAVLQKRDDGGGWIDLKLDDTSGKRESQIFKLKKDGKEGGGLIELRELDHRRSDAGGGFGVFKFKDDGAVGGKSGIIRKLEHDDSQDGRHRFQLKRGGGEMMFGEIELKHDSDQPKRLFKLKDGDGELMFGEIELDLDELKHSGDGEHPRMLAVPHVFKLDSTTGELHRLHSRDDAHHRDDLEAKLKELEAQMKELRKAIDALGREQRNRDR